MSSVDDVHSVIRELLYDKKIAVATHNISAYRIELPNGRIVRTYKVLTLSTSVCMCVCVAHHSSASVWQRQSHNLIPFVFVFVFVFVQQEEFRDDDGETGNSHLAYHKKEERKERKKGRVFLEGRTCIFQRTKRVVLASVPVCVCACACVCVRMCVCASGAGDKLLFMMARMDVRNAVVVVSRWYGGIQLGPDRFKHINNVAKEVIYSM